MDDYEEAMGHGYDDYDMEDDRYAEEEELMDMNDADSESWRQTTMPNQMLTLCRCIFHLKRLKLPVEMHRVMHLQNASHFLHAMAEYGCANRIGRLRVRS